MAISLGIYPIFRQTHLMEYHTIPGFADDFWRKLKPRWESWWGFFVDDFLESRSKHLQVWLGWPTVIESIMGEYHGWISRWYGMEDDCDISMGVMIVMIVISQKSHWYFWASENVRNIHGGMNRIEKWALGMSWFMGYVNSWQVNI